MLEKSLVQPNQARVILAMDGMDLSKSLALVSKIGNQAFASKVHDLWDAEGPSVVGMLKEAGANRVMLDLKFHDIPQTVALRAKKAYNVGADLLTVHAGGGIAMMKAAVDNFPFVLAVTVLTSLTEEEAHLLYGQPAKAAVLRLARDAKLAGVHGIVCSPQEVGVLSKRPELAGLTFVTPGVRSPGKGVDDQKRVDTPAAAIAAGARYLVVGREVVRADDPVAALTAIEEQIGAAVSAQKASA